MSHRPDTQHLLEGAVLPPKESPRSQKATLAVAASILTAAYYILKNEIAYQDLGADHFERRHKAQIAKRLARRLEELGLVVEIRPAACTVFRLDYSGQPSNLRYQLLQ